MIGDKDKYEGHDTQFGFVWGPVEISRWMSDKKYGVCIGVIVRRKGYKIVRQVWISPNGRSVKMGEPLKIRER